MNIPKKMHCIWIWDLPAPMKRINSWKEKYPTREYKLWTNEDLYNTAWYNQKAINHYIETKQLAGVADIMRYEILYKYGWVMHWADILCLNPIDELFEDWNTAYVVDTSCRDWEELKEWNKNSVAPLYACGVWNIVALSAIKKISKKIKLWSPVSTTWNRLMQKIINLYWLEDKIKKRPLHYFIPKHFDWRKYKWPDKIYAKHYWGSTRWTYKQWL